MGRSCCDIIQPVEERNVRIIHVHSTEAVWQTVSVFMLFVSVLEAVVLKHYAVPSLPLSV